MLRTTKRQKKKPEASNELECGLWCVGAKRDQRTRVLGRGGDQRRPAGGHPLQRPCLEPAFAKADRQTARRHPRDGGLVGVNLATAFLRPDGARDADAPVDLVLDHIAYMIEHVGEDGVGLGSDFDGAKVPSEKGTAAGLQNLEAMPDVASMSR
jgi:hypothetical protein